MMPEIGFYHLTRTDFQTALPPLLARTLAAGERAVVVCDSAARVSALDAALWLAEWLPHGTAAVPHPEWQPIFLSERDENPAAAGFLFRLGGAKAEVLSYKRVFDLFDGNNADAVAAARERWREAKAAGCALTYWQQGEKGWERAG